MTFELGRIGYRAFSPQVFRAINRLCGEEKISRIELIKAYVPGSPQRSANLVCTLCGSLTQLPVPAAFDELERLAIQRGMKIGRLIVESTGLCETCRDEAEAPTGMAPSSTTSD
jgi:Fe2+ or Zn2+ uptake regulation protein